MQLYLVSVEARYDRAADAVFAEAADLAGLQAAMAGMGRYDGLPTEGTLRKGDTYTTDITLFGVWTIRDYEIRVEQVDPARRVIQSRERGGGIEHWDHTLTITERDGASVWTDKVIVDAGWRTGLTARFARYMYQRRHRQRGALAVTGTIRPLTARKARS